MARAVLCPAAGGRVLEFSIQGKNALWLNPDGVGKANDTSAGRFDIGPERILPQRNVLFRGTYKGEITSARSAKLIKSTQNAMLPQGFFQECFVLSS